MKTPPIKYKGLEIKYTENWEDIKFDKKDEKLNCIYFYDKDECYGIRLGLNRCKTNEQYAHAFFEGIKACTDKIDIDILKIYDKASRNK